VHGHGALLDAVHAQNPALRRVDDGRGQQAAEYAAIADSEGTALELVRRDAVSLGALAEIADLLLQFGEALRLRVTDDRHHESLGSRDGHTDVVIVAVDDAVVTDLGVQLR